MGVAKEKPAYPIVLERTAEVGSEKLILGFGGVEGFRFRLPIVLARQLADLSNGSRNQGNLRRHGLRGHRQRSPGAFT
jgi:hypothetical protein